ncbi:nucleotidyltransferase family protein [Tenacibaculum larymnensis]|uniref:Nucleotidyltransferase family protein n=1 Tax=Tenacibaculum larymnensis TaxID=2878201 RepID=A0A9X4IN15_9FLAO|nr:nucleotidyltransferase family protein [Tenacibaculum larymnensis]MDE1208238.1 nucleotidyltransferase family protein [Tenacibaculum larymnensis]
MKTDFTTELVTIIKSDTWVISILEAVRSLHLPDCWIGAGFVRNKIWDYKHNNKRTSLNDIDVIYFDKNDITKTRELALEEQLKTINPTVNWSVKNQARMHLRNGHSPYKNCYEAISYWPETATAIAVQLNTNNQIEFIAPHGLDDLFNLVVKPTPNFDLITYRNRVTNKGWKDTWNKLIIER